MRGASRGRAESILKMNINLQFQDDDNLTTAIKFLAGIFIALAVIGLSTLFTGCAGSGSGPDGQWTPQDTAATVGAINSGLGVAERTYGDVDKYYLHPERYRAPVVVVP